MFKEEYLLTNEMIEYDRQLDVLEAYRQSQKLTDELSYDDIKEHLTTQFGYWLPDIVNVIAEYNISTDDFIFWQQSEDKEAALHILKSIKDTK
jgi:hypothetical protein